MVLLTVDDSVVLIKPGLPRRVHSFILRSKMSHCEHQTLTM